VGIACGFMSLATTLIAVACSQFDKLKAAILDIREENMKPHYGKEDGQDNAISICNLQARLNGCIRHHQGLME